MEDWSVMLLLGGFFLLLGIVLILLDRKEKDSYYEAIAGRRDVREFLAHDPERPELGALKIGGFISIVLGIVLLVVGFVWL